MAFAGGSTSVIAAGGLGGRGVNIGIWDTLTPPQSSCIGTMLFHQVLTFDLFSNPYLEIIIGD